jgi:hypothetical protein
MNYYNGESHATKSGLRQTDADGQCQPSGLLDRVAGELDNLERRLTSIDERIHNLASAIDVQMQRLAAL